MQEKTVALSKYKVVEPCLRLSDEEIVHYSGRVVWDVERKEGGIVALSRR